MKRKLIERGIQKIIATSMFANPGCNKRSIKKEIWLATYGKPYNSGVDKPIGFLWEGYFGECEYWFCPTDVVYNKWYLTEEGFDLVDLDMRLPFDEGDLVYGKNWRYVGWELGLVMECNKWGGMWLYTNERIKYFSYKDAVKGHSTYWEL